MPFTALDIVYLVIPIVVAGLITCVSASALPGSAASGLAAVAFVAGFHVGYWLLELGPLAPQTHWQWLPYALALTLPAALVPDRAGLARVVRCALFALGVAVGLWLLVPTRSNLNPSRPALIAITLPLTLVSGLALEQALRSESKRLSLVSLTAIVAAAAVILLLSGSLRFGQMAGCGLAALLGVTAAAICIRREDPFASLGLPTALFLVAAMMIGHVNSFSNVPAICYALIAVAPVTLRLFPAKGPNETRAARRWAAVAAPLLVCLVAVALAAWAELPE